MAHFKICTPPAVSACPDHHFASKRPGRNYARVEHIVGRFAAGRDDAVFALETIHLVKEFGLRVCVRSSLPPPRIQAPRWRPTASISSMKNDAGRIFWPARRDHGTRWPPTTDEHFQRPRNRKFDEERNPCLTGDGFGQENVCRGWRTDPTTHLWESLAPTAVKRIGFFGNQRPQ